MRLRKAARVAGALAGLVLVGAAIMTPRSPESPFANLTFSERGFSFEYPPTWSARHSTVAGTMSAGLARISSDGFTIPCSAEACYRPKGDRLADAGIFAFVYEFGSRSLTPSGDELGLSTRVGGFDAMWRSASPDEYCSAMGGTESVVVTVFRQPPRLRYQLVACLRAPTLRTEEMLRRLLETMRFPDSPRTST